MKRPTRARAESEEPAPRSESERRLSAWFRSNDRHGALDEVRASADTAYALGHSRGLEEASDAHLDSLRTLLTRILEARGQVEDGTLDEIERASLKRLEHWILDAALSNEPGTPPRSA